MFSLTVSYHRYAEKQADGCNLCRSTVFLGEPEKVRDNKRQRKFGISVIFKRENENETKLQFLTKVYPDSELLKTNGSVEPKVPEDAQEASPNGIMCWF